MPDAAPVNPPGWKRFLWVPVVAVVSSCVTAFAIHQYTNGHSVVAAINGSVITADAFHGRLESAYGVQVLRGMVQDELVLQYARKLGVLPTDAQLEARYREVASRPGSDPREVDPTALRAGLRVEMAREAVLGQGISVTDTEARRYYAANVDPKNPNARFYTPQTVRVAVIVTRTEERCLEAKRAIERGMSFGEAARQYSVDSSKDNAGVMPVVAAGRTGARRVPGLEPLLFGMKIGQTEGPRQLAGVWWLIRCLDAAPPRTLPFDHVKEECRAAALVSKGIGKNIPKTTEEAFHEFQKAANIQAFWSKYANVLGTR